MTPKPPFPTADDPALIAAAPALLERLIWLRDNFGVDVPVEFCEHHITRVDALIATVLPGWPHIRPRMS